MTYQEAEAVTPEQFGEHFRNNKQIRTFDELPFFTGLNRIPNDAFSGCSSLTTAAIPEGCTFIGPACFTNCSSLETLTIPSTVVTLGFMGLNGCKKLKSVYCYAKNAPGVHNSNFFTNMGNFEGRTVFVPTDATGYDTNQGWRVALDYGFVFSYTL